MKEYLVDRFHVDTLIIGYDHRLGRSSTASREELAALAASVGLKTRIVEEVHCGDRKVSSTQIRNAIAAGEVQEAAGPPEKFRRPPGCWVTAIPSSG